MPEENVVVVRFTEPSKAYQALSVLKECDAGGRAARAWRHRAAERARASGRGDDDGRPASAWYEQRPARDHPSAGDAARQGTPERAEWNCGVAAMGTT